MLHEFLTDNRAELVNLCKCKVAARRTITASDATLESGIPRFIDQLIKTKIAKLGENISVARFARFKVSEQ